MECSLVHSQEFHHRNVDRLRQIIPQSLQIDPNDLVIDESLPILGDGAFSEAKIGLFAGVHVACKCFPLVKHFRDFDPFEREISIHRSLDNISVYLFVHFQPK